jgi:hypothetical protein
MITNLNSRELAHSGRYGPLWPLCPARNRTAPAIAGSANRERTHMSANRERTHMSANRQHTQ